MPFITPLDLYSARMQAKDRRRLLKPMKTSEMVDQAFRMYQVLARPILQATSVPMVFCFAALTFLFSFILPAIFSTNQPGDAISQVTEVGVAIAIGLLVALPLFVYGVGTSIALITQFCSAYVMGGVAGAQEVIQGSRVVGKDLFRLLGIMFFRAFGLFLLGWLILFASAALDKFSGVRTGFTGFVAFLAVVGLIFGFGAIPYVLYKLAMAPSVMVNERVPAKKAVERSKILGQRLRHQSSPSSLFWGATLTSLIVFFLLWGTGAAIFGLIQAIPIIDQFLTKNIYGSFLRGLLQSLPVYLSLWLTTPLYCAAMTLLYFDRRVRVEAFDITVLREDARNAQASKSGPR